MYCSFNVCFIFIENIGALKSIFQEFELARINRSRPLPNRVENFCQIQGKRTSHQRFLNDNLSKDALSFIIALQLLRNRTQYISVAYKANRTIAKEVEPLFYSNGTFDYVRVVMENGYPKYKMLDKSEYVPFQEKIQRYQYKRAPNGLEDFTEEQLFFLAAIRVTVYI